MQRSLVHDNIVRLISDTRDEKYIYMILELCSLTLDDFIVKLPNKSLSSAQCVTVLRQILRAENHMMLSKVIHRDIKPDMFILLSQTEPLQLKLGDFGLATKVGDDRLKHRCGTSYYIAPEVVMKQEASFGSDLWSIAVTLYEVMYGIG